MTDFSDAKSLIRSAMLERRKLLSQEEQNKAAVSLASQALQNWELSQALHVGLYWTFNHEISTMDLFRKLQSQAKTLYLPRVRPVDRSIEFVAVAEVGQMVPNRYGVLEPEGNLPAVGAEHLEVLLVPGVAFDIHGNRMGWGKGYYDRLLKDYGGFTLGLAYDFQVLESLPVQEWDVPVQALATERQYRICKK